MKRARDDSEKPTGFVSPITGAPVPQRYFELLLSRSQLPVASFKEHIQRTVRENAITLLTGETGSGKTTQIPHYVAEMSDLQGVVACTQPRRVAAMSVAQRVSEEVGSMLGAHVGYNVRFDNRTSPSTRLGYYTDGMLLREFIADPNIGRFGAVIVDEAHERTVDTDLLLGLLKDLSRRRPNLRIIVMSATLDMDTFKAYFNDAPLIAVPGRTFPVDIHYASFTISSDPEHLTKGCAAKAVDIHIGLGQGDGDILIFLPGESEIVKTMRLIENRLTEVLEDRSGEVLPALVLPLYGSLPLEEQAKVFAALPPHTRKIVCATNIAETSLTIDGVVHVVDSCYVKQSLYNPSNRIGYLLPTHVSKASAQQRAGRAGRTRHGQCHRLVTEEYYKTLPDQTFPEILRCEASGTILTILKLGYSSPFTFPFISPPSQTNFLDAYMHLSFLGALQVEGGAITDEGRVIAELPTSPAAGRAIVKGAALGCSVDVAMIVSMLEAGTVFKNAFRDSAAADMKRAPFIHPAGDHLTLYKVFHGFIASRQSHEWCADHYINFKAMQQAVNVFRQLSGLMDKLKIPRNTVFKRDTNAFDDVVVRRALFEGFFGHTAMFMPGEGVPYKSVREQQAFTLHPRSGLSRSRPQWIVYESLEMQGGTPFARLATSVESGWFKSVSPDFFDWTEIEGIADIMKKALKLL